MSYTPGTVTSIAQLNAELSKIATALQDGLSRKETTGNFMDTDLDMNSKRILNLPLPISETEPARVKDVSEIAAASQGKKIVRSSADGFPEVGVYPEGTELKFYDTLDEYVLIRSETGELQWVEEGNVGDEVPVTAASHLTLAQAQASDLKLNQTVIITDRANGKFKVVSAAVVPDGKRTIALDNGLSLDYQQRYNIKAEHFGAKATGLVADNDVEYINAAIDYAKNTSESRSVELGKVHSVGAQINLPTGVNLFCSTFCTIYKDHTGDGVVRSGGLTYDYSGIKNVSVVARDSYIGTGTGIKLTQCVRNNHDNINVTDCGFGLSLLGSLSNNFGKVTLDRNGENLYLNTGSNFNMFKQTIIIADGGVGLHMLGTSYSNTFEHIDIEYADYPVWLGDGVRGVHFGVYYAEFNTNGIRTDTAGNIDDITFDTVFNSSVPMFSALFTAERKNVTINNITDEFPVGLGGADVMANTHGMGAKPIGLRESSNLGEQTARFSIAKSQSTLFGGSIFEHIGLSKAQYIGSFDLTSTTQWTAAAAAVTAVSGGFYGVADSYNLPTNTNITHVRTTGAQMANRTFTASVWIKGVRGDKFEIRMTDNVTATQSVRLEIGDSDWCLATATFKWGTGSTNFNYGLTLSTSLSTSPVEFFCPNVYESDYGLAPVLRGAANNAYLGYDIVKYINLGRNVVVQDSSAPASASGWVEKDRVENNSPTAGAYSGWVLTAGVWKGYGLIEA